MSPFRRPLRSGFNRLAKGRDGDFLYNRRDIYIGRSLEKYGEYSALELAFLKRLCGRGDVVLEVGANIGAHTVGLAKHVGPSGRVLAFEPQRLIFQTLCANVALNSLANVECYWAAVGNSGDRRAVPELDPTREQNFGGASLRGRRHGFRIECMKLDRFVSLPRVVLIKIDAEGMESEVLLGGRRLIRKFRPILYVENDRVERSKSLLRLIDRLGYRMFWHMPPLFNSKNFKSQTKNIFPGIVSVNMLCIPREATVVLEGFSEIRDFASHPLRPKSDRVKTGMTRPRVIATRWPPAGPGGPSDPGSPSDPSEPH
jgi:FkbM family methyltransferase